MEIKTEYELTVRKTVAQRIEQKQKKRDAEAELKGLNDYQDGDFAFIASYTSGGSPYGIRWEEMDEEQSGE